jgi:rhodanese-related sulfurtransferase
MILENTIHRGREQVTAQALDAIMQSGEPYTLIDTRVPGQYKEGHIATARNIPHADFRTATDTLDKDELTITYCNKGVTGNATQNILLGKGFRRVFSLSGGQKQYKKAHKK